MPFTIAQVTYKLISIRKHALNSVNTYMYLTNSRYIHLNHSNECDGVVTL